MYGTRLFRGTRVQLDESQYDVKLHFPTCFDLKGAALRRSGQQQRAAIVVHGIGAGVGIPDVPVEMYTADVEPLARQPLLFHLLEHPHVDLVDRRQQKRSRLCAAEQ